MSRYDAKIWTLAVAIAAMAGYVDATGFLKLGGLFVSFMSGNTTRLSVGIVTDPPVAVVAACLVTAFVAGVVVATLLAAAAGTRRKPAVLALVAALLAMAALIDGHVADRWTTLTMAAAIGAANTVFQRAGEVSIAVTYMTGALVKLGQRLAGVLLGGARWAWAPYLAMWAGLAGGAIMGSVVWSRLETAASGWRWSPHRCWPSARCWPDPPSRCG